jgi:hypothetical protein
MSVPPDERWKNPSAAHLQKYNLVELPEDFEPTEEEKQLLAMYETIQKHERQAAKFKEEAARAKLAAAEAEFHKKQKPKLKSRNRMKNESTTRSTDQATGSAPSSSEDEISDDDEHITHETLNQRREAKLAALRQEVEGAKQNELSEQDALRAQLLQTNDDMDDGPMLKRKKIEEKEPKSLIANITAGATPPHDFSKKLGLAVTKGRVLFPKLTGEAKWTPSAGVSPNDGTLVIELEDFDVDKASIGQGNNTIAIKFMAPKESKRFSINIALSDHDDFYSVLFHFNPRQHERGGQLIINDKKEGIWGQAIALPLSQVPLIFGQTSCTLMVQVNANGFDVFVEEKHCCRLEHRTELPTGSTNLVLQFPTTDDYGSPESWDAYKVWWGNKPIMAKGDLSGVAGYSHFNSLHPRKIFISGLSRISTEAQVDLRRAELERAFLKYGGDRGVQVIVPTNTTYAFIEMETERQADLALSEMADTYRLNRARRSRHEALQEERASKEAAGEMVLNKKNGGDAWDP